MPEFRKKPVTITAWKTIDWPAKMPEDFPGNVRFVETPEVYDSLHDTWVKFEFGDWIIRGVRGEFYPCKADVFAATYEEV